MVYYITLLNGYCAATYQVGTTIAASIKIPETRNPKLYIQKKNGKEINRIVEFPVETLEKDIFKILSGQEYKNIYADF